MTYSLISVGTLWLTTAALYGYTILDIQKVPLSGDPATAVVHISGTEPVKDVSCDVLIAGAGVGGSAAAIAVTSRGHSVCLTEETDWVGGQATAGGVPALDENRFIEFAGGTRRYMSFRNGIREWYKQNRSLTPQARASANLNPGACYVSFLCFEPTVGVAVLDKMLQRPKLTIFLRTAVFALERRGPVIETALAWQFDRHAILRIHPRLVLDATEMGDLLPLAKVPYVVGSEAKSDTDEPDAPANVNPACVGPFTYSFILERDAKPAPDPWKPPDYDAVVKRQNFALRVYYPEEFGFSGWHQYKMYGDGPPVPNWMAVPFFSWRRVLDTRNFERGVAHDVALINWPRQDYAAESPLDKSPTDLAVILQRGKQTAQAFLYWLTHDLARDDGGSGYPELKLRADEMGTADGFSKYPYIRESRRMLAQSRVTEQDILEDTQTGPRARWFDDSVGLGFYMVDVHPCGANEKGRMRMPKPYQVPMSALIPREPLNFLAAGKNSGVTHLANASYRTHAVEWTIGEASGSIAALWLEGGEAPKARAVQKVLVQAGAPIVWFDDLNASHPAFQAIQLAGLEGIYPMDSNDLHAAPDAPVTRAEAAVAIAAYFGKRLNSRDAIQNALREGWMAVDYRNWFHADLPFYWTDWREDKMPRPLPTLHADRTGPVRRWELATRLE
jgi:hypothetical protein